MFPTPLLSILDEAKLAETKERPVLCTLEATIITENKQVPAIQVESLISVSDFFQNKADFTQLVISIQPGVFQFDVLPYRDNLIVELVEQSGLNRTATRYRATPQGLSDGQMMGNTVQMSDMRVYDQLNFISVTFQLVEEAYDMMRNTITDYGVFYMANPYDVLHSRLTSEVNALGLTGGQAPRGIEIETPIDNQRIYQQIVINQGHRVIDIAHYLQKEYGLYSTGQGFYYRNRYLYVYPLFKMGRYDTKSVTMDVVRVPQDKIPVLESTYYKTSEGITILSSGEANHVNATDIRQQNQGIGQRVMNSDVLTGDAGTHYNAGRAVATRSDAVSEFKTNDRASGNGIVPLNPVPTDNVFKELSKSAMNTGSFLSFPWHNADPMFLTPLMPARYYYMVQNNVLKMREGNLTGMTTNYQPMDARLNNTFRKHCDLTLFVGNDEVTV